MADNASLQFLVSKVILLDVLARFSSSGCPTGSLSEKISECESLNRSEGTYIVLDLKMVQSSSLLEEAVKAVFHHGKVRLHVSGNFGAGEVEVTDRNLRHEKNSFSKITTLLSEGAGTETQFSKYVAFRYDDQIVLADLKNKFRVYCCSFAAGEILLSRLASIGGIQESRPDKVLSISSAFDQFVLRQSTLGFTPSTAGKCMAVAKSTNDPKEKTTGGRILLPSISSLQKARSYVDVLAGRRSTLMFDGSGLSIAEIGGVLSVSAADKDEFDETKTNFHAGRRYYPSAGGIYEIDFQIYQFVDSDLPRGIYDYDSATHELLEAVSRQLMLDEVYEQVRRISNSNGFSTSIILLGDYGILNEHYSDITATLLLRNSGAIINAIYNAASLLDIGVCSLGLNPTIRSVDDTRGEKIPVGSLILGTNAKCSP